MPPREEIAALIAKGLKNREMAEHFGVATITLCRWKAKYNLQGKCLRDYKRTDLPIGEILQMVYDGRTRAYMANKLGCSIDVLDRVMAEHGIRTRIAIARSEGAQTGRQGGIDVLPSRSAIEWANPFRL